MSAWPGRKALYPGAFFVWLAFFCFATAAPAETAPATVRVVSAIDGDTVLLQDGRLVRMIGINAPELGKDGAPDEPLARAAGERLQELVAGREVALVFERERQDRHGRTLAHLRLPDGRFAEETLLAEGLACVIAIPPNVERVARRVKIEAAARRERLGMWGENYYSPAAADKIESGRSGFRFVEGRIREAKRTRAGFHLVLSDRLSLFVPHADWERFDGRPADWVGKSVEARGWIAGHADKRRITVRHPAMLRLR